MGCRACRGLRALRHPGSLPGTVQAGPAGLAPPVQASNVNTVDLRFRREGGAAMGDVCWRLGTAALALGLALAAATPAAVAQKVSFKDPKDDDNGPGADPSPTDPVYKPGSFDMTAFTLKAHGDKVDLDVEMAAKLEDPWKTGNGFSGQMVFIFIQTRAEEPADGGKAGAAKAGGKNKNKKKGGTQSAGDKGAADKAAAGNAAGGKAAGGKADAGKGADKAPAGRPAAEETDAAAKPASAKATSAEPAPGGTAEPAPAQTDTEQAAGEKGAERKAAGAKPAGAGKAAGKQDGFTQGLPGLQVQFSPADAWDRCIILSPEPAARVRAEV